MEQITGAIRSWNPWWADIDPYKHERWIPRNLAVYLLRSVQTRHIKDILGIRRSGKTTLMHQIIHRFLQDGTDPGEILFLAFDDPALLSLPFDEILDRARFLSPKINFLFIDEVHAKPGWELWLKKIYDLQIFTQIFISGSNAALLSDEVGKALTGRHLSFFLSPFTFHEYLLSQHWANFSEPYLLTHMPELLHYFDAYLVWGGFPESIALSEPFKRQILVDLFKDILARDIATRASIDYGKMNSLAVYMLTNFTREFSVHKIAQAVDLHPDTVANYLQLLENALMIKTISRFAFKMTAQFRQNKKMFAVDNGLRTAVAFQTTQDRGKYCENAVCNALFLMHKEVYYWKDEKHEVDFLTRAGGVITDIIQVCWDLSDAKVKSREIAGIVAACNHYGHPSGLILTLNANFEEVHAGIVIKFRSIALWLLEAGDSVFSLRY